MLSSQHSEQDSIWILLPADLSAGFKFFVFKLQRMSVELSFCCFSFFALIEDATF